MMTLTLLSLKSQITPPSKKPSSHSPLTRVQVMMDYLLSSIRTYGEQPKKPLSKLSSIFYQWSPTQSPLPHIFALIPKN